MPATRLILRLLPDVMVGAGMARDAAEAQAMIDRAAAELAVEAAPSDAAAASAHCPSCPSLQADRLAALDGIAGAFLQLSEHFELLAEPPQAATATPRPTGRVGGSCQA